jgi:hypothetical protein
MVLLFDSLLKRDTDQPVIAPLPADNVSGNWRYELRAMLAGFGNQLWVVAQHLGLDHQWQWIDELVRPQSVRQSAARGGPSWTDYEAWIASLQPHAAPWNTPASGADGPSAFSRRQVLQFAVAGLNHAAKTLSALADRLELAVAGEAAPQVGALGTHQSPR